MIFPVGVLVICTMQCTVHYIRWLWLTKLVIYWWCSNTKVPLVMMMVPLVMMMVRLVMVMVPLAMLVVMVQLKLHSQDLCGVSFHLDLPWVATHSQCWEWIAKCKNAIQAKTNAMQCATNCSTIIAKIICYNHYHKMCYNHCFCKNAQHQKFLRSSSNKHWGTMGVHWITHHLALKKCFMTWMYDAFNTNQNIVKKDVLLQCPRYIFLSFRHFLIWW